MTDDLVKRLRIIGAWKTPGGPLPSEEMIKPHLTCEEAANRIEGLMAVIASMEPEVNFLNCLRHAGVNNWDGYEYALELMEEEDDQ
jgi:hypothetical protein